LQEIKIILSAANSAMEMWFDDGWSAAYRYRIGDKIAF
jgi:hypothetical protein